MISKSPPTAVVPHTAGHLGKYMHVIPVLLEAEAQGLQAKVSLEYRVSSAVAWVTSWQTVSKVKRKIGLQHS